MRKRGKLFWLAVVVGLLFVCGGIANLVDPFSRTTVTKSGVVNPAVDI